MRLATSSDDLREFRRQIGSARSAVIRSEKQDRNRKESSNAARAHRDARNHRSTPCKGQFMARV